MTKLTLNAEYLKRIDENRAKLITARMLQKKHDDASDKLRALLDAANNAADAAGQGLTDHLLNKISDAELEKLRAAARKAASDFNDAKDIKSKLSDLVRQHDESDIRANTKHAREELCNQMFEAWLAEFKEDKQLLERLMGGFAMYGDALSSGFNHVGWQRFLLACFGVEHDHQLADVAKAALISKHKFLQD